ncbi:hypothetical protein, partial [uncultured Methanobrevibacter sp.]|uniref:hypothetical protein n=1 Tax=uncultured Methanobrevibacter sp. TaxID=253161 RepID=UPI0025D3753D
EKDVYHESKADFVHTGRCRSNTFILDMADGCALTAQLAARELLETGFSNFAFVPYEGKRYWSDIKGDDHAFEEDIRAKLEKITA